MNDARTNRTLLLLAFAAFFGAAALRVCDPLLPRFASEFGVSAGTAGRVVIGFAIAYGVLQLAFGALGDRYGKLRLIRVPHAGAAARPGLCSGPASGRLVRDQQAFQAGNAVLDLQLASLERRDLQPGRQAPGLRHREPVHRRPPPVAGHEYDLLT